MARWIKADGMEQQVTPKNGYEFTLEEMRAYIGGSLEGLRLSSRLHMYLDEEGVRKQKPLNTVAMDVVLEYRQNRLPIVGDVLIADISETGDE